MDHLHPAFPKSTMKALMYKTQLIVDLGKVPRRRSAAVGLRKGRRGCVHRGTTKSLANENSLSDVTSTANDNAGILCPYVGEAQPSNGKTSRLP